MSSNRVGVSICICTYRRPGLLNHLLEALRGLIENDLFSWSVVVVDNDDRQSAREVVRAAQEWLSRPILYDVEPERSISLARNRAIRNAGGELIAFIDDDEFPESNWLVRLYDTLRVTDADAVLGPVEPFFDERAPAWLVRSRLCERPRFKTGTVITDPRYTRTGNVLLRRNLFAGADGQFDRRYGKSGGGDTVFFKRMIQHGKKLVWCDEARVFEVVPPERQTRGYYVKRAFARGRATAMETRLASIGTIRSLAAIVLYTSALPFLLLLGQHLFMRYAVKDCDHLGKILGHLGISVVRERP